MRVLKIIALLLVVCVLSVGGWSYWFIFRDLPSVKELRDIEPTRLSKVLASDGSILGYYPPDGRIVLDGKNIPPLFKQAFVAAEDATFYTHAGLDMKRIFSALVADIRAASYVQGASTITQQVIRSYLLTREKTITRKIRELVLALRIERTLSKEEILNLYLDRIYLGSGAYGIQAASLRYFGKESRDLNLSEISFITGLAPAPARYSPLNDFNASKRRQWYVLQRMVQEGFITETEALDAYKEPLRIIAKDIALFTDEPYVTDYVRTLVTQRFGEEVFSQGITIQTTLSSKLQAAAVRAVRKGLIDLEIRQGEYRGAVKDVTDAAKERIFALQANQITWQGLKEYDLYWAEVVQIAPLIVNIGTRNVEVNKESFAWVNPKGSWNPADVLRQGDLVQLCFTPKGFILSQQPRVQAALVAFDLERSEVVSLVGGSDYAVSQFNRAVSARRQSGSAIKPFLYAAALDKGMTTASIIFDAPITFREEEEEEAWRPKNYEDKFFGPTTLRTGLVLSRNVVTIKILKDIGIGYTLNYLKRFNLDSELPRDLSLALGSGVVTPFNLFKGYAMFATYGFQFDPHLINSIVASDVGPIFTSRTDRVSGIEKPPSDEQTRMLSEQTAYIITNILQEVVQEGTGWRARALKRPIAGKTGTSDNNRDAWFIGFTPGMLCGVWVGYDDMIPLGEHETGSRAASPIFVDFMRVALEDRPVRDFHVPEGVVFARVDLETGALASDDSPKVRFECFKEGTLPPKKESAYHERMLKEVY